MSFSILGFLGGFIFDKGFNISSKLKTKRNSVFIITILGMVMIGSFKWLEFINMINSNIYQIISFMILGIIVYFTLNIKGEKGRI